MLLTIGSSCFAFPAALRDSFDYQAAMEPLHATIDARPHEDGRHAAGGAHGTHGAHAGGGVHGGGWADRAGAHGGRATVGVDANGNAVAYRPRWTTN